GAGVLVACAYAFVRVPASRGPIVVSLGLLGPVINVIPTGLEARLSDRFLYAPAVGVALGLAAAGIALSSRRPWAAPSLIALGLALIPSTRARAELFRTNDTLFGWEATRTRGSLTVLLNAGAAAARAKRFREAR